MEGVPQSTQKPENITLSNERKDLWVAVIFYIHYAIFFGLYAYAAFYREEPLGSKVHVFKDSLIFLFVEMGVMLGISISLSVVALALINLAPVGLMHISMLGSVALMTFFGISTLLMDRGIHGIGACVVDLLIAAGFLAGYIERKRKIPFSVATLKTATKRINASPLIYLGVCGAILLQACFFINTSMLLTYLSVAAGTKLFKYVSGIYAIFSLYWVSGVVNNVIRMTVTGNFVKHYSLPRGRLADHAASPFTHAMVWSIGSICLSSLIMPPIQMLSYILKNTTGKKNNLADRFNYYAFTQIIVHDKSFMDASRDAWKLMKEHGLVYIVNGNLVGEVIGKVAFGIGLISGFTTCSVAYLMFDKSFEESFGAGILFGMLSIMASMTMFQAVSAGATAMFACIAEDTEAFQRNEPEMSDLIVSKYGVLP